MTGLTTEELLSAFEDVKAALAEHGTLEEIVRQMGFEDDEFFRASAAIGTALDAKWEDGDLWPPQSPFERKFGLNQAWCYGFLSCLVALRQSVGVRNG